MNGLKCVWHDALYEVLELGGFGPGDLDAETMKVIESYSYTTEAHLFTARYTRGTWTPWKRRKKKHKSKKRRVREKKRAARAAAEEAELPPCREIATPPEVLAALEAADRAATPEPTVPADPSLFKPGGTEPTGPPEPAPSKPGGASSWGRGFLAIGTTAKEPDLRDPYAYIASTVDDDDLEPALHDAPSPNFDGLVIEEVTPEELEALNV